MIAVTPPKKANLPPDTDQGYIRALWA